MTTDKPMTLDELAATCARVRAPLPWTYAIDTGGDSLTCIRLETVPEGVDYPPGAMLLQEPMSRRLLAATTDAGLDPLLLGVPVRVVTDAEALRVAALCMAQYAREHPARFGFLTERLPRLQDPWSPVLSRMP